MPAEKARAAEDRDQRVVVGLQGHERRVLGALASWTGCAGLQEGTEAV
jgi:hypothetical protein